MSSPTDDVEFLTKSINALCEIPDSLIEELFGISTKVQVPEGTH